ncbi:MAG: BON domain-containing protein [Verrucomicrobiota bacterium]|nr:BON domain-containing protein [Verrucomicrobiota bacterium]
MKNGAVTLDGTVRDAAAKKTVEEIAHLAPGTHEATNQLRPRESK